MYIYIYIYIDRFIFRLRDDRCRISGYVENFDGNYGPGDFRRNFRVSREIFGVILRYFEGMPNLQVDLHHGGREPLTVEKQLLMTLWYLGSQDTVHKIADRFGVSESTVLKIRNKIVDGTLEHLLQKLTKWPDQNEENDISNYFERKDGFPGIIECLDGTHIPICAPKESAASYVNRKGFHSLQLQGV